MRKYILFPLLSVLMIHSASVQASHPPIENDLPQPITVINSTASELNLYFEMPEFDLQPVEMDDGQLYMKFSAPGAGFSLEGKPDVPVYSAWILVPNGTRPTLVIDPSGEELVDDIQLSPVQAPVADLDESPIPAFIQDELTYGTDAEYPGELAKLEDQGLMRGQQIAILKIYPVQHNPVTGKLLIYHSMTISIDFDGDPEPIPDNLKSNTYDKLYHKLSLNAEEVLEAEQAAPPSAAQPGAYGWDYLIFTDPNYLNAANTFAAWKQQKGYKTLVTQMPTQWQAKDIQKALEAAYKNWSKAPEFVLFLGDAEHIPTNYNTWHPYNSTPWKGNYNTQGFIGTDFNYSLLDGDHIPDVFLGRISVDTVSQAEERLKAIKNYEKTPATNASFYKTVMLGADFEDGGTITVIQKDGSSTTETFATNGVEDRRFTQTTEDFAIFLSDPSKGDKTVKRIYYADSTNSPSNWYDDDEKPQSWKNFNGPNTYIGNPIPNYLKRTSGFQWNGDYTQVRNAVQAGAFLVTQRGHGGSGHWKHPYFSWSDALLIQNPSLLPVIWSLNCQTGWFDNETDFKKITGMKDHSPDWQVSFSEAWERPAYRSYGDYGAVGILASTRVTYGTYNERLYEGMADTLFSDYLKLGVPGFGPTYQMGPAVSLAKAYMQSMTPAGITETVQMEGYHWFGDPSMEIRTEKPPLTLAFPATNWPTFLNRHDFVVQVELLEGSSQPNQPIHGAQVVISHDENPDELFTARTDEEGVAVFEDLLLSELGSYGLLVSASNHIPFMQTFEVEPGGSGGIQLDSDLYTCNHEVGVKLADSHLAGSGDIEVQLLSNQGEGDTERVILEEIGPGFFWGGIATRPGRSNPGNGQLEVSDTITITVQYYDEENEFSLAGWVEDTALVDCTAPDFDGLESVQAHGSFVDLAWNPARDANRLVVYQVYRATQPGALAPDAPTEMIASTWAESFTDYNCPYGQTCYYQVRAQDMAGNTDGNNIQGSATPTGMYLPLITKPE